MIKIILFSFCFFCIAIDVNFTFAMNFSFNIHSRIYIFCHKVFVLSFTHGQWDKVYLNKPVRELVLVKLRLSRACLHCRIIVNLHPIVVKAIHSSSKQISDRTCRCNQKMQV